MNRYLVEYVRIIWHKGNKRVPFGEALGNPERPWRRRIVSYHRLRFLVRNQNIDRLTVTKL